MKIHVGPGNPKLHGVETRPPARVSFPDLIAAPDRARAETAGRAAGFQALGMFGVCNATAYQLIHQPRPTDPATPANAASRSDRAAQGRSTPPAATHSGVPTLATTNPPTPAPAPRPFSAATPYGRDAAAGGLLAEIASDPPDGPTIDPDREQMSSRQPRRGQGARSLQGAVRVIASAPGTAAVVANLLGLSADEAERFRTRAEGVAREFGLVLDKVAVNGDGRAQVDPWGRRPQSWR